MVRVSYVRKADRYIGVGSSFPADPVMTVLRKYRVSRKRRRAQKGKGWKMNMAKTLLKETKRGMRKALREKSLREVSRGFKRGAKKAIRKKCQDASRIDSILFLIKT